MTAAASSLLRVTALAGASWRQAVRDKLLHVLAGFAVVMIGGSFVVSELTVGERARIVMDLGLSATALLSVLVAAFVTANQAAREIERKTVVIVLSKPVARWELLAGRFLGMSATLAVMVACMSLLHAGVLLAVDGYRATMWPAVVLTWLEAILVVAIALFFSSFATPLPSMFLTLAFIVIGHTSWGLRMLAERTASAVAKVALEILFRALPNLALLDMRSPVTWGDPVPWAHVAQGFAYTAGYAGMLLALASALMSRRDLT